MIRWNRGSRDHHLHKREDAELNLIPLIDILSVMVAFLLVYSVDVEVVQNSKGVEIPQSTADALPNQSVVVMITREQLFVQGELVADIADVQQAEEAYIVPLLAVLARPMVGVEADAESQQAALASRGKAPSELKGSSLPRLSTPVPSEIIAVDERTVPVEVEAPLKIEQLSAWAKRLIEVLYARALIELGNANLEEITYHLGGLLQAHGTEAEHSLDTAEWLANEIGAVRGISKLFATGGDLQIALRRSRDA
jgi:biopolymer transport protein ExbD